MVIVDVDLRESWPAPIAAQVDEWASEYRGSTQYAADLAIPIEAEHGFLRLFRGHVLRGFHATKLLAHERDSVSRQGLKVLSRTSVEDRISAAVNAGAISLDDAEMFARWNVFAQNEATYREGQVCFFLSDYILREDVAAVETVLRHWGGEAMFKAAGPEVRERLARLGSPAIVIALLDVSSKPDKHRFFPSLTHIFVGRALGLEGSSGDLLYRADVPPSAIERIAGPGDRWYDRYPVLAR